MSSISFFSFIAKFPITQCLWNDGLPTNSPHAKICPQDSKVRNTVTDILQGMLRTIGEYQPKQTGKSEFDDKKTMCTQKESENHRICNLQKEFVLDVAIEDNKGMPSIKYYRQGQEMRPDLSFSGNCDSNDCTVTVTTLAGVDLLSPPKEMKIETGIKDTQFYCTQTFSDKRSSPIVHDCKTGILDFNPFLTQGILPQSDAERAEIEAQAEAKAADAQARAAAQAAKSSEDLKMAAYIGAGILTLGLVYTVAQTAYEYFSSKEDTIPVARRSK